MYSVTLAKAAPVFFSAEGGCSALDCALDAGPCEATGGRALAAGTSGASGRNSSTPANATVASDLFIVAPAEQDTLFGPRAFGDVAKSTGNERRARKEREGFAPICYALWRESPNSTRSDGSVSSNRSSSSSSLADDVTRHRMATAARPSSTSMIAMRVGF